MVLYYLLCACMYIFNISFDVNVRAPVTWLNCLIKWQQMQIISFERRSRSDFHKVYCICIYSTCSMNWWSDQCWSQPRTPQAGTARGVCRCSLTVPVVSCCGTLSQPVQTSVQSVLDPVLCAGGVLHLHHSGSAGWNNTGMFVKQSSCCAEYICLYPHIFSKVCRTWRNTLCVELKLYKDQCTLSTFSHANGQVSSIQSEL